MKKMENQSSEVSQITDQIWSIAELLRGKVDSDNYYIILYVLSLYKDGLIRDTTYESMDTLNKHFDGSHRNHQFYFKVHLVFGSTIMSIGKELMTNVITHLFEINRETLILNFSKIFDSILYNIAQSQGKKSGEFLQPKELTDFLLSFSKLPQGGSVFNPFAGLASFAINLDHEDNYLGQEINHKTWALGLLRILAYNRHSTITFNQTDTINNWPENDLFDLIISNPPLGMRLNSTDKAKTLKYNSAEEFVIGKGLENIKEDGKIISIVSNGFLFKGGSGKKLREKLIQEDLLETVISLPAGLFYSTGIPVVIIVINKKKERTGKIRFIDGKDFFQTLNKRQKTLDYTKLLDEIRKEDKSSVVEYVSNEKIIHNDYNLNVGRYFISEIEGSPLNEIISPIIKNYPKELEQGKFVRIRDLKDDKLNYSLNARDIEIEKLPNSRVQLIDRSCMLLAVRWNSLKPTYFHYEGTPILISTDIQAFKINEEKVFIDYLFYELHSEYVKEQLESYSSGSFVPYISKEDLLNIKIDLPSPSEQQSKIRGVKELSKEIESVKKEQSNIAHENQNVQFNEFASLKHTLGRPRQNIVDWTDNLIDHFSAFHKGFDKMDSEFKNFYEVSIIGALKEIKNDINFITDVLEKGENGLILKDHPKKLISLFELNDIVRNISENGYKFKVDPDLLEGNSLITRGVNCNIILLKTLLDNLLTNANKHAFNLKSKGNLVSLKLDIIDDNLILELKDNGKGFPKNYNKEKFITKYSTANPENGSGLGGYDINRIAVYFENPDWDLILNEDPVYPTIFRFQFPIKPIK